jgi:O-antigen ligase
MPSQKKFLPLVFYYSITGIAFFLPLYTRATAIFIILMLLSWIADGDLSSKLKSLFKNKTALLFIAVFLVYAIGMFYTSNVREGLTNLLLKVSFLLFPLLLFVPGTLKIPSWKTIFKVFLWGCLLTSIALLSVAAFTFFTTGKNNFYYGFLAKPLGLHPAVFSMYLLLCVFGLLLPFLFRDQEPYFHNKWHTRLFIVFFSVMIFLLSSRQEIIVFLLLLPIVFLIYFFRQKRWLTGLALSTAIVVGFLAIVFLIPETKMRLVKMQEQLDEPYSNDAPNSVTMRKVIWESAAEIIREHPVTGVGTGDAADMLKRKYREKNLVSPLNENLNAHNQYLQTAITIGIPGLLIVLLSLFAGFRLAIQHRAAIYLLFLLIFVICNLTESMLEAEAGVVFFTFFNSLMAVDIKNKPDES